MHKDILIVGQGICGTFLSWYLEQAGISYLVIDQLQANTASKVAAGIINPVTGRRIVKTWMIEEVMPFAHEAYNSLGAELGITAIEQKSIVDFYATPQMKLAFEKRYQDDQQYLAVPSDENYWRHLFNYDFGYGEIDPCYLIRLQDILPAYRTHLANKDLLREELFEQEHLQVQPDGIRYKDLTASRIIFSDGIAAASNSYFQNLPFALNKGEAVWAEIDGLPATHIFKKGFNLVPWKDNIFWLGSTYLWEFDNDNPTPGFKQFAHNWLLQTVKLPFKILDHKAAVRPATLERRPFVGFHPQYPAIGLFNGMGTKGCSLGPWFARQLVQHLQTGAPLAPEADIRRFQRILTR
ncbi:FAD-dependent oxidoreductase [Paraflavitalea sp. CAU 1676]|uniref:NAD(P)/FAD-dependent oxidoreductase n=1 Tax=Paraflavitalea sp. CAU 1676 TaxID=3032598 RepID=UPI0023DC513B|nr:FAD-dependent oxidoreductase [Paraflavitalea sp. CAU 1676]MDF2189399.1 FAD-dependent oxidoreductase [Paraflavitalea sp. CAU 1676]